MVVNEAVHSDIGPFTKLSVCEGVILTSRTMMNLMGSHEGMTYQPPTQFPLNNAQGGKAFARISISSLL